MEKQLGKNRNKVERPGSGMEKKIDLLTEDIIIYCKDDYIDENNTTYKKGFYLYDLDLNKWNLINSSNNVNIDESTEDNTPITLISLEGTEYSINAEKITQTIGLETIEVLFSYTPCY